MAIVNNRFDLRLLNHLVEKTGGANEATLLAYYTLRLPACPGYEKAAQFQGLMNFDNHIASIRSRATRLEGGQDTLDLFNVAWTLGIIDWRREDSREFAAVVSHLYKLTLDFEMLRVQPSILDLELGDLEVIINDIMRRAALDSNVYKPTAELKRKLKIAKETLSRN